jgi:hypothetical protein
MTPEAVFLVKLGTSSFLAENEFLNDFPLHLVPSWERAHSRTDLKYGLRFSGLHQELSVFAMVLGNEFD